MKMLLAGLAVLGLAAATLPATSASAHRSDRGQLITATPLRTLTTGADVADALTEAKFDPAPARYGVDTYQLIYRTVDPAGRPTVASGLLALPRNGARQLRTVSYTHGTELNRLDAPSLTADGWGVAPALTFASAGFAAVAPDYLGLGLGPGPHPFLDVPSETTAGVDLLRAARAFVPRTGRELGRDVLVTGFSQGGSAATGLAKALHGGADDWFRLRALAPISGAYDVRGVELPALIDGTVEPPWNVGYTAYLMVSWNRLHHLYDDPAEVFNDKIADRVEGLYDGVHDGDDLGELLPMRLDQLYTRHGLKLLTEPSGPFAAALRVHDATCSGWQPGVPVRLLVSAGDEQVPTANAEHCAASFRTVPVVDVGDLKYEGSIHLGSNIRGTAAAATWFASLR
ncbi:lipase [Actinoplanes sp. NPDC048791]|uniref:alpha/beta hydrolase family protein n=1 Tax=Actinoplanes sp. NPDC048791 TaxID=3154623 RepID=UPI0033D8B5CB